MKLAGTAVRRLRLGLALVLALGTSTGAAGATVVHRCVGADGMPRYQDTPCRAGDEAERLLLPDEPSVTPAAPTAAAAPAVDSDKPSQRPPPAAPPPMSWRCDVDNGEVFFRHDGCPPSLTEPVVLDGPMGAGFAGMRYLRVWATPVPRTEACRAIDRGMRFGHERDQRADPYEKLSGRDLCR